MASPLPSTKPHEVMSESVPIFLKKTYHMIDSCDPLVAGWDDDGLTFTVKDPVKFETLIIPQFFKHSKFTSFVRQLNFYSFRKIKYSDSIRIDLETEKRTANFWRFRHEHFQRGRADLLTEIKRMNGKASTSTSTGSTTKTNTNSNTNSITPTSAAAKATSNLAEVPVPVPSSNLAVATATKVIQVAEKSEVLKLKKRIEEMTKNMDKLTEMVQKVTLQQDKDHSVQKEEPGMKRKKANQSAQAHQSLPVPVETLAMDISMPDMALSHMDMEELNFAAMPLVPASVLSMDVCSPPPSLPVSRETSDNEFVDQLFTAFEKDDEAADWMLSHIQDHDDDDDAYCGNGDMHSHSSSSHHQSNRPDPELMKRLSDALQLLPREIQEMIVTRLIAAITSTDGFDTFVPVVSAAAGGGTTAASASSIFPAAATSSFAQVEPKKVAVASKALPPVAAVPEEQQQPLPLAAATLAALLHHYSNQVKEAAAAVGNNNNSNSPQAKKNLKALPVIPVHA